MTDPPILAGAFIKSAVFTIKRLFLYRKESSRRTEAGSFSRLSRARFPLESDQRTGMHVYRTVSTTTARAVLPVTGFEAR